MKLIVRGAIIDEVLLVGEPCGYGPDQLPILPKSGIQDTKTAIIFWEREAASFCEILRER
jgi:hypothetical protein